MVLSIGGCGRTELEVVHELNLRRMFGEGFDLFAVINDGMGRWV